MKDPDIRQCSPYFKSEPTITELPFEYVGLARKCAENNLEWERQLEEQRKKGKTK